MLGRTLRPLVGVEDADRTVAFQAEYRLFHVICLDDSHASAGEEDQGEERSYQYLGVSWQHKIHRLLLW